MRPYKHVAAKRTDNQADLRFQNIIGIDIARFKTPWGEVPLVATTERDRITLFAWNDRAQPPQWDDFERPHARLTADAVELDDPNGWNWSRRVSIACSSDTAFLVYKRRHIADGTAGPVRFTIDRFQLDGEKLAFVDSFDIPSLPSPREHLGFNIWAGMDNVQNKLLLLFQGKGEIVSREALPWTLFLFTLPLNNLRNTLQWTRTIIGSGGYDLDAHISGRRLFALYRQRAAAIRFPPPLAPFDITSAAESDQFYAPLALSGIDLDSLNVNTEILPGGEHPQLQSVEPLIITFDRERKTTIRRDTAAPIPLPPHLPRIVWDSTQVDKIAFVRRPEGDFRGVVLSADADVLPRGLQRFSRAMHLIGADEDGAPGHATPLPLFPVQLIDFFYGPKHVALDLLHHLQFVALVRTRITAGIRDKDLNLVDQPFEVWDIGHARLGDPERQRPSADPENRQFAPFVAAAGTASAIGMAPDWQLDNTMGGHVVADLDGGASGFFAYTDMGDGGLRVIFSPRFEALPLPPPVEDPKTLRPEQVTGPHLPDEDWFEIAVTSDDRWMPSGLLAYSVGVKHVGRSLGAAPEVAIDSLLDATEDVNLAGLAPGGTDIVPFEGMTEAQIGAVDIFRASLVPPRIIDVTMSDGAVVQVTITPGSSIEGVPLTFTASAGGAPLTPTFWTFLLERTGLNIPDGPIPPGPTLTQTTALVSLTPAAAVTLPAAGRWRISLFLPGAGSGTVGSAGAARLSVATGASDLVWALHDRLRSNDYVVRDLHTSFLQYDFQYDVDDAGKRLKVAITTLPQRQTELRFRSGGLGQGIIDCRTAIDLDTTEVQLKGALGLAFNASLLKVESLYARSFTPGVLMCDQHALDALTGDDLERDPANTVGRADPLEHAALAAKPVDDSSIHTTAHVEVGVNWLVTVSAVIAALVAIAAIPLVQLLVAQLGLAGLSLLVPVAAVVAAGVILLTLALLFWAAAAAKEDVEKKINTDPSTRQSLDRQGFLRYAGEGISEALSRAALTAPAALNDADEIGRDRLRGQEIETIFVADNVCRVLVRPIPKD